MRLRPCRCPGILVVAGRAPDRLALQQEHGAVANFGVTRASFPDRAVITEQMGPPLIRASLDDPFDQGFPYEEKACRSTQGFGGGVEHR